MKDDGGHEYYPSGRAIEFPLSQANITEESSEKLCAVSDVVRLLPLSLLG